MLPAAFVKQLDILHENLKKKIFGDHSFRTDKNSYYFSGRLKKSAVNTIALSVFRVYTKKYPIFTKTIISLKRVRVIM